MRKSDDLSGERFGMLVAVAPVGENKHGQAMWSFVCDCGNHKTARGTQARQGAITDCGCSGKQRNIDRLTKHGMFGTRLYNIYFCMTRRCYDPKSKSYPRYGAVGVSVCDEWRNSVEKFMNWALENGYKDSLSIDRINGNLGYSPENCRWATHEEQQNNLKSNRRESFNGELLTIAQIARLTNQPYHRIYEKSVKERVI